MSVANVFILFLQILNNFHILMFVKNSFMENAKTYQIIPENASKRLWHGLYS